MTKSRLGYWDLKDFFNGLLIAVLVAVLATIKTSLESGVFTFDWKHIGNVAMIAAGAYLLKNLGSNNAGQFLTRNKK